MNKLTGRISFWIALLVLLLLPFLLLSFFCHPSSDDYVVSQVVRDGGISAHLLQTFTKWSGRYFSTIINCFNPLIYGWITGYKLIPVVLILLFYAAVYSLIRSFFRQNLSKIKRHLFALILVLLFFNNLPSTSECIYWMTGSLNYFLATILTVFFFALFIKFIYNEELKLHQKLLLFLLPVLIIGANEVNMLFLDEMLFIVLIVDLLGRKKISKGFVLILLIAIIASAVTVLMPGNYIKMEIFPNRMNLIYSMKESFLSFIKISGAFIKDPGFIICSMLFISILPEIYKYERLMSFIKIPPFYALPVSIVILISLYFPVVFSTGLSPALRIHNSVGFFFMMAWFYNIASLHYYFYRKQKIVIIEVPSFLIKLLGIGAILLVATDFSKDPGKEMSPNGNIFRAAYDLCLNATTYNNEMNARYDIIEMNRKQDNLEVAVPPLSCVPSTIFFVDLKTDPKDEVNYGMSKYFGLQSIRISKTSDNELP